MYAIVEIQGQQFRAEAGKFLYVHYHGDGAVKVGAPTVEGAKIVCEVKRPLVKGDKVIVFKKKRRNDYVRKNGHRQMFSQIVIKDVIA